MIASTDFKSRVFKFLEGIGDGDGIYETRVPGLTLMRSSMVTLPQYTFYRPSLCLIIQGAKEMSMGETSITYREGQSLIVTLDLPALGRVTEASAKHPYVAFSLEFDAAGLRDVIEQMTTTPYVGGDLGCGLFVEEASEPIMDCIFRLIRMADHPDGLKILHPSIMRELFYWLLTGPNGGKIARVAVGSAPAQRIGSAIQFIKDSFASPITIEQLAELASMSPSSFHQHFKSLTSMTPLQFQKQLRLIEARHLMTAGTINVAEAAFEVGYESASQFSREYSRMFGHSPARDRLLFQRRLSKAA